LLPQRHRVCNLIPFHLSLHHTHVVLTATVGLQAKQLIAMPDCPPETRMHFLPLSWNHPFNLLPHQAFKI
jgi:hypothetical protein